MPRPVNYSPIVNIEIDGKTTQGFICSRCGYVWIPARTVVFPPVKCPGCTSPYWNIPKWKFRRSIRKDA